MTSPRPPTCGWPQAKAFFSPQSRSTTGITFSRHKIKKPTLPAEAIFNVTEISVRGPYRRAGRAGMGVLGVNLGHLALSHSAPRC